MKAYKINPFLFISGLSYPRYIQALFQALFISELSTITIPYNFLPVSCGKWRYKNLDQILVQISGRKDPLLPCRPTCQPARCKLLEYWMFGVLKKKLSSPNGHFNLQGVVMPDAASSNKKSEQNGHFNLHRAYISY